MPKRVRSGANFGRRTRQARSNVNSRARQSVEQRQNRYTLNRERTARSRSVRTAEERETSNERDRIRMRRNRVNLDRSHEYLNTWMARQMPVTTNLLRAAFAYDNIIDYSAHKFVVIGAVDNKCGHCNALKFKNETPGMCCASGKVKLPILNCPPEPLRSLVSGLTSSSKHFLSKIQTYNSCFQMTSFGATKIVTDNFMPTFKVITSFGISNQNFTNESSGIYTNTDEYVSVQIQ